MSKENLNCIWCNLKNLVHKKLILLIAIMSTKMTEKFRFRLCRLFQDNTYNLYLISKTISSQF